MTPRLLGVLIHFYRCGQYFPYARPVGGRGKSDANRQFFPLNQRSVDDACPPQRGERFRQQGNTPPIRDVTQ